MIHQTVEWSSVFGIELLAVDRGPGMNNPSECLRDGYSTAGSPGTGLGAISRLATTFDIYSVGGIGTILLARFLPSMKTRRLTSEQIEVGALCIPMPGESIVGDAWAVMNRQRITLLLVSDGLGHGPLASEASRQAVRTFRESAHIRPEEMLREIHGELRWTRGAAAAVAAIDWDEGSVRFAGVGNISGFVSTCENTRNLVSHNGIVGSTLRRVQEFTYPWEDNSVLVMYTDGFSSRWNLCTFPGLVRKHPALVSAMLYRDNWRGTDDAAIVTIKKSTVEKVLQ